MKNRLKQLWAKVRMHHAAIRQNSKRLFWTWILYQTVKGLLTTTFIWIPAYMMWVGK